MEHLRLLQVILPLLVVFVYWPSTVSGRCTVLPYPQQYLNCCRSLEGDGEYNHVTGEQIHAFCRQTYLIKTPEERYIRETKTESGFGYLAKLLSESVAQWSYNETDTEYVQDISFGGEKYRKKRAIRRPLPRFRGQFSHRRPPPFMSRPGMSPRRPPPSAARPGLFNSRRPSPPAPNVPQMGQNHYRKGCLRREIRDLSPQELQNFHRVLKMAREDTSLYPNGWKYFGNWHSGQKIKGVHGGTAFLPWHRFLLFSLERYLKKFDPNFCLPYWDGSLEASMPIPFERSSLFSDEYLGSGRSVVTGNYGGLGIFRNVVQQPGLLISRNKIETIKKCPVDYINFYEGKPNTNADCIIEAHHNFGHLSIGGNMNDLDLAPNDPIFWLHHANVDRMYYINQMANPGKKFVYGTGQHAANAPLPSFGEILKIHWIPGASDQPLTMAHGTDPIWLQYVQYSGGIQCTNGVCGKGRKVFCRHGNCYATPNIPRRPTGRQKRSAGEYRKHTLPTNPAIQHDFYIDGKNDASNWAYLPVPIVFMRPKGLKFNSYFVKNGSLDYKRDMYDKETYDDLKNNIKTGNAKTLDECEVDESGQVRVTIESTGKNYKGFYPDYALLDERFPITEGISYVGFKKPCSSKPSEVMFSAYDSCGRICKPMCLVEGSNPPMYKHCSGILRIDNQPPLMFGNSIAEAMKLHWNFPNPSSHSLPYTNKNVYCLKFLCDSATKYTWEEDPDSY